MTNEGICLDALEKFTEHKQSSLARIVNCADTVRQKWVYDFKLQQIRQDESGNCLTAVPNRQNATQPKLELNDLKNDENKFIVQTESCKDSVQQKWMLFPLDWK